MTGTEYTEASSVREVDPIGSPPAGFIIQRIIWLLDQGFLFAQILSFRFPALAEVGKDLSLAESERKLSVGGGGLGWCPTGILGMWWWNTIGGVAWYTEVCKSRREDVGSKKAGSVSFSEL